MGPGLAKQPSTPEEKAAWDKLIAQGEQQKEAERLAAEELQSKIPRAPPPWTAVLSTSTVTQPPEGYWTIPADVLLSIAKFLSNAEDLLALGLTCKRYYGLLIRPYDDYESVERNLMIKLATIVRLEIEKEEKHFKFTITKQLPKGKRHGRQTKWTSAGDTDTTALSQALVHLLKGVLQIGIDPFTGAAYLSNQVVVIEWDKVAPLEKLFQYYLRQTKTHFYRYDRLIS